MKTSKMLKQSKKIDSENIETFEKISSSKKHKLSLAKSS